MSIHQTLPEAGIGAANAFWMALTDGTVQCQYDAETCRFQFYPRPLSLFRVNGPLEWRPVSGLGTLIAHTVLRVPTPGYAVKPPYAVGIVKLDEGPRIFGPVSFADGHELRIGDRVRIEPATDAGAVPRFMFTRIASL
jgi:uncharacterized OB-fold protein